MTMDAILSRIDEDLPAATERLLEFLRIPSISGDPAFKADCERAADWLVADLQSMGIEASKRPTPGHPLVVGHLGDSGPHLLFYAHYDVQPVDPLDLWDHDPFDPQVRNTSSGPVISGRGSSDDKGQLMTFFEALRAWKEIKGDWPCRITFLLEGEEESSSPSLAPFMKENADELKTDIALICDTSLFESRTPAIVTMLRGFLDEELTITAASLDLHSGMYGGIATNPVRALGRIVASLHDEAGRITLPGFYDGVPELPATLEKQWQGLAFDHAEFLGDVGLSQPAGEPGFSPLEMIWSRPTCDVCGIWAGYIGDGFKTVLPAKAHAKISFRLVGTQDPLAIRENFRTHVQDMLPPDCQVSFTSHGAAAAASVDIDGPMFEAAREALSCEWGIPAAYIGCGASIPIAGLFQDILGTEPMLIGFGKDSDAIHSPNEKYDMESFHKGIRSWVRILDALTKAGQTKTPARH